MAIVKVHNKARNITYVYESVSYWDKELKQPRSHRKLIGRIDPATGAVVPTGKRSRIIPAASDAQYSDTDSDYRTLYEQALSIITQKDAVILELQTKLAAAESENTSCRENISKACDILMDSVAGKDRIHG